jgi:hypothetical protein
MNKRAIRYVTGIISSYTSLLTFLNHYRVLDQPYRRNTNAVGIKAIICQNGPLSPSKLSCALLSPFLGLLLEFLVRVHVSVFVEMS